MADDEKATEAKPEAVEKKAAPPVVAPAPPTPPKAKPGRKSGDRPFRATVRIEYPSANGMVEVLPGEVASDIPSDTIKPWLAQGIIEEVSV